MMEQWINDFPQQLAYEPVLCGAEKLGTYASYVVVGMGGSNLCTELIGTINLKLDIIIHRDYGLPNIPAERLKKSLIILSSYSGTTEEVLSAYAEARAKGLSILAITTGGTLLAHAQHDGIPYIQIPATGIPPRLSLGYRLKALTAIMNLQEASAELTRLATQLPIATIQDQAKNIAHAIGTSIPVIYASTLNLPLTYTWKIAINENTKHPAFCNAIPEMNHNEMVGLTKAFHVLLLQDPEDHPRVQKRMLVMHDLLQQQGIPVTLIPLQGSSRIERSVITVLMSIWASFFMANQLGIDPESVPLVEEFKKLIAK